jgi:Flp pilus assembly protein TadG
MWVIFFISNLVLLMFMFYKKGGLFLVKKKLLIEEKGQSMVLVAIFLVILIAFAGLAIDGGRIYFSKSQLQKAVDAGALAGAKTLIDGTVPSIDYDYEGAKTKAKSIADQNYQIEQDYIANITPTGITNFDKFVEVTGNETVKFKLLSVLGLTGTSVTAYARVKIGKVNTVKEGLVVPVGLPYSEDTFPKPGDLVNLTPGAGEHSGPGNYHLLDFGTESVAHYIVNGSPTPISLWDLIDPQPGNAINKNIEDAFAARAAIDPIFYVPIIEKFYNGKSMQVKVIGFAAFRYEGIDKDKIKATFINEVMPGEIGDSGGNFGAYSAKLDM